MTNDEGIKKPVRIVLTPLAAIGILGTVGAFSAYAFWRLQVTMKSETPKSSLSVAPAPDASALPDLEVASGPFQPTWDSLKQYQCPEWFRDAKFGIWAHWSAQCEPEQGDWYARHMYSEGHPQYQFHKTKYGPQSQFGFKDVIHQWKAENWNPEKLMTLYKRAGAQYFMALANHHDNFDNWNSKYQPWNSVNMGPRRDIIDGWAKAARKNGLRFGVSVHAAHAWTWMETAQRADKNGPQAGIPYDGKLTKADGKGTWWEGYDPQDLYAQNHPLSTNSDDINAIHSQWNWGNGASIPDTAYCKKFLNRTIDLINAYQPDLVYFDDTALPLYPASDVGLKIAAHLYNSNKARHQGKLEAVLFGKILDKEQQKCMVWDIERGQSNQVEQSVWQTDTCIGDWHYNRSLFDQHRYKTAKTVIHTLADVVSKNGNLLLSIPVRGDGSIDSDEETVLEGIARWMQVNRESIFGTRPWKIYGEGPAAAKAAPLRAQGFNEGTVFGEDDVRFTTKGNNLYAIAMGWPDNGAITVRTLAANAPGIKGKIRKVSLLGTSKVEWIQDATGLVVTVPDKKPCDHAYVLKIEGLNLAASQPVVPAIASSVIRAGKDGSFTLGAARADLHGSGIRAETRANGVNLGYWDNPQDSASWTIDVARPGVYKVSARIAAQNVSPAFVIEAAGKTLEATAPNTASWDTFRAVDVGTVRFTTAGQQVITIRPKDSATWKPINLASLTLTPAP